VDTEHLAAVGGGDELDRTADVAVGERSGDIGQLTAGIPVSSTRCAGASAASALAAATRPVAAAT
jgi:hypothetical protein